MKFIGIDMRQKVDKLQEHLSGVFKKAHRKWPVSSPFFNKIACHQPVILFKKLWHRCFPVTSTKPLWITFFYTLNKEKVAGINCRQKILVTFATFPSCYNGFSDLSRHLIPITLNFLKEKKKQFYLIFC